MTYTFVCRVLAVFALLFQYSAYGQVSASKHFVLERLSPGVFAAIADKDGHAICNAGIIDLGDQTVVIDPFLAPDAAADLKAAAMTLTGRPATVVINTHFHDDHTGGNQVFLPAKIISTPITRDAYLNEQPKAIEHDKQLAPALFDRFNAMDTAGMNDFERDERRLLLRYFEAKQSCADSLRMTPPDSVFTRELVLKGNERSIRLIETAGGHSPSDVIVWLEKEKVLFAGDLVFSGFHPNLEDGNNEKWMCSLKRLKGLHPSLIVPGHGSVSTVKSVRTMKKYLTMIKKQAKQSPEFSVHMPIPKPFDTWHIATFFETNIKAQQSVYRKK